MLEMIEAAHLAFSNSLKDSIILAAATGFGYDESKLQQGLSLCERARQAVGEQDRATGTQLAATAEADKARQHAQGAYQLLAQVARAVFLDEPAKLKAMGLVGVMPAATDAFLGMAKEIYQAALKPGEIADALAAVNLDTTKLQAAFELIKVYDQANQAQEAAKSVVQEATQKQNAVLDELYLFYAQYIKLIRVALRENRQLLEALQVPARTSPTEAQAEARRKRRDPD
jgi:hypothetical protein